MKVIASISEMTRFSENLRRQDQTIAFVPTMGFLHEDHFALFGEKDYQQLAIIRQLVTDLNFDIEVVGVPIVREPDGLAKSSRNKYLTPKERPHALLLHRCIQASEKMVIEGETDAQKIEDMATKILLSCPDITVDYVSICDPVSLDRVTEIQEKALMAVAVWMGKTRLIDNQILVRPDKSV